MLTLWGVAVSGWTALFSLTILFFDPQFGWMIVTSIVGLCILLIVRSWRLLFSPLTIRTLAPFGFCVAYTGALLILAIVPSGVTEPLEFVRSRFSDPLPADNALPLLFARNVLSAIFPTPMLGDWLGSDRPPLQSAYFLVASLGLPEFFGSIRNQDLAYQVQGSLLQSFWLAGIWVLLDELELPRFARWGALALCAVSGFAFVHGIFVWPKLLPVLHLCIIVAIAIPSKRPRLSTWRLGVLIGCNAALSLLCHGGSIFALAGIGVYALLNRRIPTLKFLFSVAVVAILVLAPWSLYQRYFDPPGDRLLKWHLAGLVNVDDRPFTAVLAEAYQMMTWRQFVHSKLADLAVIAGRPWGWVAMQFKAFSFDFFSADTLQLRRAQFESVFATLGFFAWAPIAWSVLKRRLADSAPLKAATMLFGVGCATLVIWILAMYEPGSTSIHQGSLASVAFFLVGSFLFCFSLSRPLAAVLLAMQLFVSVRIYMASQPDANGPSVALLSGFDWMLAIGLVVLAAWVVKRFAEP